MCWWTVGQGFAFGKDAGGFIGTSNFAFSQSQDEDEGEGRTLATWFFFWAFSGMVLYSMV